MTGLLLWLIIGELITISVTRVVNFADVARFTNQKALAIYGRRMPPFVPYIWAALIVVLWPVFLIMAAVYILRK